MFIGYSTRRCFAQPPLSNITKFEFGVDFRTNVCDRQRLFFEGKATLTSALRGLNLSVATTKYSEDSDLFSLDEYGMVRPDGLYTSILDELARRAGFSWKNSYVATTPLDPEIDFGKSWTDVLHWQVDHFDISFDHWAKSVHRMSKGIAFPESWYDASIILVEDENRHRNDTSAFLSYWSFLWPFTTWLWFAIAVSSCFSGFVYWLLERLNANSDMGYGVENPISTVFHAAMTVVGHFNFHPATTAAKLLSFSWCFYCLICGSAYTANLASFLVARSNTARIESIDEAVQLKAPVCIQAAGIEDETLTARYPTINLVRKTTQEEVFQALLNGDCLIAATQASAFEVHQRNADINVDCRLNWVGHVVHIIPSGFAVAVDSGNLCTSLISHSLDIHMSNMKADGTMDRIWQGHLQKVGDHNCLDTSHSEYAKRTTSDGLTVTDMGGIFIMHAFFSLFSIGLALFEFYYMKKHSTADMIQRLKMSSEDFARYIMNTEVDADETMPAIPRRKTSFVSRRSSGDGSVVDSVDLEASDHRRQDNPVQVRHRNLRVNTSQKQPMRNAVGRFKDSLQAECNPGPYYDHHYVDKEESTIVTSMERRPSFGLPSFQDFSNSTVDSTNSLVDDLDSSQLFLKATAFDRKLMRRKRLKKMISKRQKMTSKRAVNGKGSQRQLGDPFVQDEELRPFTATQV